MRQLLQSLLLRVQNVFDHENARCIKITCFPPSGQTSWPSLQILSKQGSTALSVLLILFYHILMFRILYVPISLYVP